VPELSLNFNQYDLYKKMSSSDRVKIACQLHDFAFQRLKAYLCQRMENASEDIIRKELFKRFLGESAGIFHQDT